MIDFEHGERAEGERARQQGNVLLEHFSLKINVFSYYLRVGGFHKNAVI